MTIERFEELRIGQEAREQANAPYDFFETGSRGEGDFGFRDQLQRCGVSVMNNIAEGFERRSDVDFARFLDMAKGSNGEVRSMLYLAEDRLYVETTRALDLRQRSESLSTGIATLSKHLCI